jgi:hypothetical protein
VCRLCTSRRARGASARGLKPERARVTGGGRAIFVSVSVSDHVHVNVHVYVDVDVNADDQRLPRPVCQTRTAASRFPQLIPEGAGAGGGGAWGMFGLSNEKSLFFSSLYDSVSFQRGF